jgi:hypothetical protein
MEAVVIAFKRGYDDREAGNHLNPYLFDIENAQFRAWIEGYNTARAEQEARTSRSIQDYYQSCRAKTGGGVTWVGD